MSLAIVALAGCASSPPVQRAQDLDCALPSNCATSLDSASLPPLRYGGSAEQGMATLRSTLASFPEASIVYADATRVQAIFTTTVGFRDQVDFVLDPAGQKIDYRSRSLFGLFDFNKNRSRMREIAERFAQRARPAAPR